MSNSSILTRNMIKIYENLLIIESDVSKENLKTSKTYHKHHRHSLRDLFSNLFIILMGKWNPREEPQRRRSHMYPLWLDTSSLDKPGLLLLILCFFPATSQYTNYAQHYCGGPSVKGFSTKDFMKEVRFKLNPKE